MAVSQICSSARKALPPFAILSSLILLAQGPAAVLLPVVKVEQREGPRVQPEVPARAALERDDVR